MVECNMSTAVMRGCAVLPGSKSTSRAKESCRNFGGPAFGQGRHALVRIGKTKSRSRSWTDTGSFKSRIWQHSCQVA